MDKFIPYEKLSKKEKRKRDNAKRSIWGDLKPVTRKPENSRAYNRKKAQSWKNESSNSVLFFVYSGSILNPNIVVFGIKLKLFSGFTMLLQLICTL